MDIEEIGGTLSRHKVATAIGVVGLFIILYLLFSSRGGGSSAQPASAGADPNDVAAATQAYVANQQAQTTIQGDTIAAGAAANQTAAALTAYQLGQQTTQQANTLSAQIQEEQINAAQQVTSQANALTAQTQQKAIDAQVQTQAIAANTTIQTTNTIAAAYTNMAQINASEVTGLAQIQGQNQVNAIRAQGNCSGLAGFFGAC